MQRSGVSAISATSSISPFKPSFSHLQRRLFKLLSPLPPRVLEKIFSPVFLRNLLPKDLLRQRVRQLLE